MTTCYEQRGVSSSKEDVHTAIAAMDKGLFPGAFCKIFPDIAGDRDYCTISHMDGAGTKADLAYLAWREGFGIGVWKGIATDSLVMNIDDMACVGAIARGVGFSPFFVTQLINRNKFRIPAEVISALIQGCSDECDSLAAPDAFHCIFAGGETADLPDLVRTITVDNAVTARMHRLTVIDASRVVPGDVIVGFSSTGQAKWEHKPNSGIGSNGLTNARHDCLSHVYAEKYPETFSPEVPDDLVYRGKYLLSDPLPDDDQFTVGSALLSPTRMYLPLIAELIRTISPIKDLHALIHCSGGGQTKIGRFGGPGMIYLKNDLFPLPPLFAFLREASRLTWREMYMSYNMGHRLEAVVTERVVEHVIAVARERRIEAKVIGRVERNPNSRNLVVIETEDGQFTYDF